MENKNEYLEHMNITFLGTGTSTGVPQLGCGCKTCTSTDPKDKRLRSSALVKVNHTQILIDAGPDLRQQLIRSAVHHLDGILITHSHYDHVGGLDDVRPLGETKIYCEKRVAQVIYQNMPYCFAENRYPGVPKIEPVEIDENDFFIDDVKITPIRVFHAKLPILGYRIGDFAYLTDVKTMEESAFEKLKGIRVLAINALRHEPHISHITLKEAIEISKRIQPETTYFTHFSHDLGRHEEISKILPENIFLSYDELSINL